MLNFSDNIDEINEDEMKHIIKIVKVMMTYQ